MTATATAGTRGSVGGGWGLVALLVAVVTLLVLASGPGGGEPYDLDSAQPSGYKGLRLLLEDLGATVRPVDAGAVDTSSTADTDVLFVPVAVGAPSDLVERWRSFARAGGTVVLGTPLEIDEDQGFDDFGFDIVAAPPGECDIARLRDAEEIDPAGTFGISVPAEAESCYGDGDVALIVSEDEGAGDIVTLAGPDLFTNEAMRPHDQEVDDPQAPIRDNVVVATRLLDPGGSAHVAIVNSGIDTALGGNASFVDLIRPGVKLGIWQLAAAFVIYAWYRGRRLGRVVTESHPVPNAASELVGAVGNLMERRGDPGRAAAMLRRETTGEPPMRLGVPRATDPSVVASMIAGRTGRDADAVLATLSTRPVTSDEQLLAVSAQLEAIRQEVLHGRRATTD